MSTPITPQQRAETCARLMMQDDAATQALGIELLRVAPGQASLSMQVTGAMLNGHGTCHGGCIFTLADSTFAFACNAYNQRCVAQHTQITYVAPAQKGDTLTTDATEVSRTGRSGIYDVTVSNQHGIPVAHFRGMSRTIKGQHFDETGETA